MNWRGPTIMAATVATAIVIAYGLVFAHTAGVFRHLEPVTPGTCRAIAGFLGPEDFALDAEAGVAYVTVADRRAVAAGTGAPKGDIALLDLKAADPRPVRLNVADPDNFFPHGLDLYVGANGIKRLFAVNHGADGRHHSIEIFDVNADATLSHAETVATPVLTSPNDVAAAGPRAFYASIDLGAATEAGRLFETYMLLPWGRIVHYDGANGRVVRQRLRYGNGVSYDAASRTLYVAESTGRRLTAYTVGDGDDLARKWSLSIPMTLDNISFAPDGALLVAGHPKALAFVGHAADPARPSPSQVVRVTVKDGAPEYETVYLDDGTGISGASAAIEYGGRLFIGAVFSDHVEMCGPG